MANLFKEIKHDANFIKSHTLQPKWYKIFKVFMILGFLAGYYFFFGTEKTLIFCGVFFSLSFGVHMVYRLKTNKFTQSWLDFIVVEVNGVGKPSSIGKFYYAAVVINILIGIMISQLAA